MISIFVTVSERFGLKPKEAERFFKFAIVGAIGFLVDFGIFNLLLVPFELLLADGTRFHESLFGLGFSHIQIEALARTFASTISFIAAIVSNFIWNRYWTYPDSRGRSLRRQLALFTVVSVAGIIIRIPIITYTHTPFANLAAKIAVFEPFAERIGDNLALVLAVLVVMFWNFFINRYWTYNDVD